MAQYSLFVLKVPLNTNQPTFRRKSSNFSKNCVANALHYASDRTNHLQRDQDDQRGRRQRRGGHRGGQSRRIKDRQRDRRSVGQRVDADTDGRQRSAV